MKIALVGNMNNNFFSLMRYLRDLGLDAYLLTYRNELSHFTPENDTWSYEKWAPFIKKTKIVNGGLKSYFSYSKQFLLRELSGYDYYITNGFSPALFRKAGLKIDLFMPYSINIEYTYFYNKQRIIDYLAEPLFHFLQKRGLKSTVKLLGTVDVGAYNRAIEYKLKAIPLAMPMVYVEDQASLDIGLETIIKKFADYQLTVFSHVSHFPHGSDGHKIKRNDVIIRGFAEFRHKHIDIKPLLVLLDYGQGVDDSKALIAELGITDQVLWLPKMARKELMAILNHIDIGAGEFGGDMWGGTVWEFMSAGKSFFQYVALKDNEISRLLNAPCPKFFNTNDPVRIAEILFEYTENPEKYRKLGKNIQQWFQEYAGLGLAQRYKDIIKVPKT